MSVAIGDTVILTITKVVGYGCWGTFQGQTGFVHCVEWAREKPVPESRVPTVGDQLRVKVFRLVAGPQSQLPPDVTYGGTVSVDFGASAALVEDV
jgi:hypothetical protein